jgi:hypothetical protein
LVFINQAFPAKHQDRKFDIHIVMPMQLADVTFFQEKKQLVLTTNDMIDPSSYDFSMRVDIPKEMVSGPFSASFDSGIDLAIMENQTTDSLISSPMINLTNQQHNTINMTEVMGGGGVMQNHTHRTIISGTNVVPEFPLRITSFVYALAIMGMILAIRKMATTERSFFFFDASTHKTY